jgi:signal transduction histidine kinase
MTRQPNEQIGLLNESGGPLVMNVFASACVVGGLFGWMVNFATNYVAGTAPLAVVLGMAALVMLKRKWNRAAAYVLVWGLLVATSVGAFRGNGLYNPGWVVMPVATMLIGWMLGSRAAIWLAAATLLVVGTLLWQHVAGQAFRTQSPIVVATAVILIVIIAAVIGSVSAATYQRQLGEVKALHDQLQQSNADLEQRVALRTAELSATVARLKQTQLDLVQSEKMAALGSLVAGVSHELNTPIGNGMVVASTLQEQARRFDAAVAQGITRTALDGFVTDIRDGADLLMDSLRRAVDLVSSFKQVAVDQTSQNRRAFFLRKTIDENLMTLGPTLRKTPHVVVSDIPEEIRLQSYPGPLGQVLTNLINNALIHGLQGTAQGKITLHARDIHEGWVEISVQDDGAGIAPEHLARVFDPFFTTRLGQGGSGLGLNIVYNIVTQTLGGTIHVESVFGQGARFILQLPCIAPVVAAT